MNAQAEKWAELDLQVSLLTEHELTRVLTLVTKIARAVNVDVDEDRRSRNCQRYSSDNVLDTIEKASQ